LTHKLGFADAAVLLFSGSDGQTVVAVVEPQFAARVRYKTVPEGASFVPQGWEAGVALIEKEPMGFQAAVLQYGTVLTKGVDAAVAALEANWSAEDISTARVVWDFLKNQSSPIKCAQAVWCLDNAVQAPVRQLSATILLNYHHEDVAWWALVDGLRDSNDNVKMACQQILNAMGKQFARPIEWKPAIPALRAVLDGTNLFAFGTIVRVLNATSVAPELAPDLLAGAGHALLAHAKAESESMRKGTVTLLERLSGKKLDTPNSCAEWVGKLKTKEPEKQR
jgi:hypothetical protein